MNDNMFNEKQYNQQQNNQQHPQAQYPQSNISQAQGFNNQQVNTSHNNMNPQQQNNLQVLNPTNNTQAVIVKEDYHFPPLSQGSAILILVLNIFFPGLGTMVMGCMSESACYWICVGITQFLLCFIIVGWIWAIITGIMAIQFAQKKHSNININNNIAMM